MATPGIAVDASSPASGTLTGTGAIVTASFTPPKGATIIAVVVAGTTLGGSQAPVMSDSAVGTWDVAKQINVSNSIPVASISRRRQAATGAAMTVTGTFANAPSGESMKVLVLVGARNDGGNQVLNIGANSGGSGVTSSVATLVPQRLGSLLVMCFGSTATTTAQTLNGNSTQMFNAAVGGQIQCAAYMTADTTSLGSTTFGFTNTGLSATQTALAAVEIFAAQPPMFVEVKSQAVMRAANWMKRASGLFAPEHERILIPRLALSR